MDAKKNCWEFMACGRQPGGARVAELGACPAATDTAADGLNDGHNAGRLCWAVAGTLCGGQVQGTIAAKEISCLSCNFYKTVSLEQGASFQWLKPGQVYKPRGKAR